MLWFNAPFQNKLLSSLLMMGVPPLWVGQVSIAGSAIATLHKEFSSGSARKIIRPVKSPSPASRAAGTREPPEPVPPPFKYQFGSDLQTGVVYSGGLDRMYEDWGTQVCNFGWWD